MTHRKGLGKVRGTYVFLGQATGMGKAAGVSLETLPGEEQSSDSEDGCSWHESGIWLEKVTAEGMSGVGGLSGVEGGGCLGVLDRDGARDLGQGDL